MYASQLVVGGSDALNRLFERHKTSATLALTVDSEATGRTDDISEYSWAKWIHVEWLHGYRDGITSLSDEASPDGQALDLARASVRSILLYICRLWCFETLSGKVVQSREFS
jgi:hypothetical protein